MANSAGKAREQIVAADTATFTPAMRIEHGNARLSITGDISSVAHEA